MYAIRMLCICYTYTFVNISYIIFKNIRIFVTRFYSVRLKKGAKI
jgi:hypothetical protein